MKFKEFLKLLESNKRHTTGEDSTDAIVLAVVIGLVFLIIYIQS